MGLVRSEVIATLRPTFFGRIGWKNGIKRVSGFFENLRSRRRELGMHYYGKRNGVPDQSMCCMPGRI